MKIGILLTGHSAEPLIPEFGDYDGMFRRLLAAPGNSFETWSVIDGTFPARPDAADAWVLTGSRCGVYDGDPWIAELEGFLRTAAAWRVPIAGICFGHQVVAQAFGGTVEKYEGGWMVGLKTYDFADIDRPVRLVAWHQDQVIVPPDGAQIVAAAEGCRFAAMRIGPRILTVQPHPEFAVDYIRALATVRAEAVGEANAAAAAASLDGAAPDDFAPYLLDFLRSAAGKNKGTGSAAAE